MKKQLTMGRLNNTITDDIITENDKTIKYHFITIMNERMSHLEWKWDCNDLYLCFLDYFEQNQDFVDRVYGELFSFHNDSEEGKCCICELNKKYFKMYRDTDEKNDEGYNVNLCSIKCKEAYESQL